jgi:hypothetical protein
MRNEFRFRQCDDLLGFTRAEQLTEGCIESVAQALIDLGQETRRPFACAVPTATTPQGQFSQLRVESGAYSQQLCRAPVTAQIIDRICDLIPQNIQPGLRQGRGTIQEADENLFAQQSSAVWRIADHLTLDDHVEDGRASSRNVFVDEPSQRFRVVYEGFYRHPFKRERLTTGRFKRIKDDDEIDVRQVRTLSSHDRSGRETE